MRQSTEGVERVEIAEETAAEMARRVMWLDDLIRLHVGRDCTLIRRGHSFEVRRPCGTGTQLVARGTYVLAAAEIDQALQQLVHR